MHETALPDPMSALLDRSQSLEQAVIDCFPTAGIVLAASSSQNELAAASCSLCIEHSHTLRAAFSVNAPNSASAVLRLQYEALLRGVWLMFAAKPEQVKKLSSTLNLESELAAKNLPGCLDMLNAVAKVAPAGLVAPLMEFNQYTRHALNSFVHSGIHALHRSRYGYPLEMGLTVVRFSNAVMHFAYRLLASLSGSQQRMNRVTRIYIDFHDCLPMAQV